MSESTKSGKDDHPGAHGHVVRPGGGHVVSVHPRIAEGRVVIAAGVGSTSATVAISPADARELGTMLLHIADHIETQSTRSSSAKGEQT